MPGIKKVELFRRGNNGEDESELIQVKAGGHLRFNALGKARCVSGNSVHDGFELLPAAALAAGKNPFFLVGGSATIVAGARATKGGVYLITNTTPVSGNNTFLAAVAEAGMSGLLNAKSFLRLSGIFAIPTITAMFGFIGLEQNASDADPSGTANDGVGIVYSPNGASALTVATGLTAADHENLIIHYKVGGADTFVATNVKLVAGRDYSFAIEFGADLKAKVYIDDVLVATTAALTTGTTLRTFAGVETTEGVRKDLEVRHLCLERTVG